MLITVAANKALIPEYTEIVLQFGIISIKQFFERQKKVKDFYLAMGAGCGQGWGPQLFS